MSTARPALGLLVTEGANDKFVALETVKKLRPTWSADAKRWGGGFHAPDAQGDVDAIKRFRDALSLGPNGRAGLASTQTTSLESASRTVSHSCSTSSRPSRCLRRSPSRDGSNTRILRAAGCG